MSGGLRTCHIADIWDDMISGVLSEPWWTPEGLGNLLGCDARPAHAQAAAASPAPKNKLFEEKAPSAGAPAHAAAAQGVPPAGRGRAWKLKASGWAAVREGQGAGLAPPPWVKEATGTGAGGREQQPEAVGWRRALSSESFGSSTSSTLSHMSVDDHASMPDRPDAVLLRAVHR